MRFVTTHPLHVGSRLLMALMVGVAALALGGCPFSNFSEPAQAPAPAAPTAPPGGTPGEPPPAQSVPTPAAPLPTPTALDGTLAVTLGQTGTGALKGTGTGALTYAIVVPALSGTAKLLDASTGAFSYTPNTNFIGGDRLQFTVSDSVGTSKPATVLIQVAAPVLGAAQVAANVGANTDWVCYWCIAQPYVDMVKQASSFGDAVSGIGLAQEGKLDADGWPMADFRWMVLCCVKPDGGPDNPGPASPLAGAYQLSFNGKAKISPLTFKVVNQQYDVASNTTTATLDLGANYTGQNSMLTFSNTQRTASAAVGSGVTNIRIIRPQFAPNGMKWWDSPNQEFTQPFLDSFKGLSTIRFINWTKVIGSPEVDWADRTPGNWPVAGAITQAAASSLPYLVPPSASCTQYCDWYATGQSWESAIDVANATRTDMWINVPVMATDAYVKSLALLIKSKLDASLNVYIEWSDEIWNYGNPYWTETNYNTDQTKALLQSNPQAAADYAANCVSWANGMCHVAERVKQFGDVFATVFGASAINTRIRPVLCMQVVQPVFLMETLRYIALTYGPPNKYFYGTCGAPYWGAKPKLTAGSTVAETVAAMNGGVADNNGYIEADTAIALHYGLRNLSYEGGPSLVGSGASAAVLDAANIDPGMQANVVSGLGEFFKHGGDMYMYYSIAGSGSYWGASPDPLDLHAPKLAGLHAMAGQTVTRTAGTLLPGSVAAKPPIFALKSNTPVPTYQMANCNGATSCGFGSSVPVGDGYAYLVTVPQAGTFTVSVDLDGTSSGASLELAVDGKSAGIFSITKTPPATTPSASSLNVTLTAGVHVIALLNASTSGSGNVSALTFTRH